MSDLFHAVFGMLLAKNTTLLTFSDNKRFWRFEMCPALLNICSDGTLVLHIQRYFLAR